MEFQSFCNINPVLCAAGKDTDPVNFSFFLTNVANFKFSQDRIDITDVSMRWEYTDLNGELLTNYTLENINFGMKIMSRPEFA